MMRVAQQRWLSEWAAPALAFERAVTNAAAQQSFLLSGKALFDQYRAASDAVNRQVDADVAAEQTAEHNVVLIALGVAGAMLVVTVAVARRQHRALRTAVVAPIDDLLLTMRKVGGGGLTAQPSGVGPPSSVRLRWSLAA